MQIVGTANPNPTNQGKFAMRHYTTPLGVDVSVASDISCEQLAEMAQRARRDFGMPKSEDETTPCTSQRVDTEVPFPI